MGKTPFKQRLWLKSTHTVFSDFGSGRRGGSAPVWYGLEVDSRPEAARPSASLTVDPLVLPVGTQSLTSVVGVMREVGARLAVAEGSECDLKCDFRSLAYICGFVSSYTSAGLEPVFSQAAAAVPSTSNYTMQAGDCLMFTRPIFKNNNEFRTLLYLCGEAGNEEVHFACGSVPKAGARLKGESLGVFANRVYANIMAETTSIAAAASHAEAKFSGSVAAMKLLGHSQEGGAMRKIIRTRNYPKSVGLIRTHLTSIVGLNTNENLHEKDLLRYEIASLLEGAGRVARSDPTKSKNGLPSMYKPDEFSGKPSSMSGFENSVYDLFANWRKLAVEELSLVSDTTSDFQSFSAYFDRDSDEDHYKHARVVPFYWVEPGPISTSLNSSIQMLGCQGKGVTLDMIPNAVGYKTAAYQEHKGVAFPGSVVRLVSSGGYHARSAGINLLFSGRYTKANGLSQFKQVTFSASGVLNGDLAMAGDSSGTLADRRWHTFHNPTPNPGECFTDRPFACSYTYSGGLEEPTLEEFVNGKVESLFGTLHLADPEDKASKYHRSVPDYLEETFASTNGLLGFLEDAANVVDMATIVSREVVPVVHPVERGVFVGPSQVGEVEQNERDTGEPEPGSLGPSEETETPSSAAEVRPEMSTEGAEGGS